MEITFIHLLRSDDKVLDLLNVVSETARCKVNPLLFLMQNKLFTSIEGCPLAYRAPRQMLSLSTKKQILSTKGVVARQGIGASTRFHRLVWEVPSRLIGSYWFHMAHGTSPSKFYKPTTHVFLWADDGKEAKADIVHRYPYLKGNYGFKIQAEEYYRKPGLCYGKRTENFTVQIMPSNHVFSFEGTAIFTDGSFVDDWSLLALLNSTPIDHWLSIICAEHKAYNYVEAIPIPEDTRKFHFALREKAQNSWSLQRNLDTCNPTSPVFVRPAVMNEIEKTLRSSVDAFTMNIKAANAALARIQIEIDDVVIHLYGLTEPLHVVEEDGITDVELADEDKDYDFGYDISALVYQYFDYLIGVLLGRWDIRIALDPSLAPKLPDPFAPLPVCPPGMLVGPDGLPAQPGGIVSEEWLRKRAEGGMQYADGIWTIPNGDDLLPTALCVLLTDADYPVRVQWDGVLVDDPGFNGASPHREDVVRRVREVLDLIWKGKAPDIEQEACDILGVSDLREYFRRPGGFFQDHLKRYSKSRRKAPIYWPLSTASGSYTVWLYYHRLTDQTLYLAVNKYVEPKIAEVERGLARLEDELPSASGRDAARLRDRLREGRAFLGELRDFREELLRVAALPYKPNLNDGVIINAAPLHKLFRLRSWAKDTEECWKKLQKGDYDWAHLAYTIWPDRVREVCKKDRSIAIAHGLEELCEVKPPDNKKKSGKGRRKRKPV